MDDIAAHGFDRWTAADYRLPKKRLTWARYQNHGKINTSKINSSPPHVDSGTYASYWRISPVVYLDLRGNAFALKYLPYMPLSQVGQFRHIFSTQIVSFNRKDCKDVHTLWRGDLPMPTWDFAGHKFRFATLKKDKRRRNAGRKRNRSSRESKRLC